MKVNKQDFMTFNEILANNLSFKDGFDELMEIVEKERLIT